jgi:hypothetical protein
MRLQGGSYPLSDEEVLQIAVESGTPSGLLRGKTLNPTTNRSLRRNGKKRRFPKA